jgi:hypothetical protein
VRLSTLAAACCIVHSIPAAQPMPVEETTVTAAARSALALMIYNELEYTATVKWQHGRRRSAAHASPAAI